MNTGNTRPANVIEILEARIAPAVIYAVNDSNQLISFDSATPGTIIDTKSIVGLVNAVDEKIKGIDFRPATGELYALGLTVVTGADNDQGRIYKLNTNTGELTQVGGAPFYSLFETNADFGFDFNPFSDRIRVVTDGDKSMRVNPISGALAGTDTELAPATSGIIGAAYDRNFDGTGLTTLFGIDNNTNSLVTIGGIDGDPSPNLGAVTVIGGLGVAVDSFKAGFDIDSRSGIAFAAMHSNTANTSLFTIDLLTGAATLVGAISGNPFLNGIAVALPNDLTIVSATTASYIDQDGDKVTIKITGAGPGASLSTEDFVFSTGQFGSQLKLINFSDDGTEWAKASITITAVPVAGKGDSFATVGYINATGIDLGKVSVNGDMGQIDAGDATTTTPGLLGLTVQSMGNISNSQLATSAVVPDQTSNIVGKLGALTVKSDLTRELITVTGGAVDGSIGPVFIGGDIIGTGAFAVSGISATGSIASVKVLGSIHGGSTDSVGGITAGAAIGPVFLGGSLFGGTAAFTGQIVATNMGTVTIKGSIFGGTADHTGYIRSDVKMGNVVISGSIVGGNVASKADIDSGFIGAFTGGGTGLMGTVKVLGSLIGSGGNFSGTIYTDGVIASVTVGGYLQGGAGDRSGAILAGVKLGPVKVAGDLLGSGGDHSGSVTTFFDGSITSVTIGGSVVGTTNARTGIISANQLGPVKITGDLRSDTAGNVRIAAEGDTTQANTNPALAVAIKSVTILGSVRNAVIAGGVSTTNVPTNPDATIGPVNVGGNWISSSLAAGVTSADAFYGNADDVKTTETGGADLLFSKIASVTIRGYAFGTVTVSGAPDSYGIIAEQVGPVKIGLRSYLLAPGTDLVGLALGTTPDFRVREV